jgi:signal transduction histidine kinase/DNA-binding NarL/FixJ family response regulator
MTLKKLHSLFSWKRLTIRRKLQYSIIGFAFIVLIINAITLSLSANEHFHQSSQRELTLLAGVLADNSRAALTFKDAEAAEKILSAVEKNPNVLSAIIYTDDHVFATYPADLKDIETVLSFSKATWEKQGFYYALEPIIVNTNTLGWLRLKSKLNSWDLVWRSLLTNISGLLIAVTLLAVFMSYWLKKQITLPLRHLSDWATEVSENKNFNTRVEKTSEDEIGHLCDSLNAMLNQLSKQKLILSLNHKLSDEIKVRTLTEQELIKMRDKAEKANRSKSEFLANMSHEIRTPMNAIIGFVDIVLESDLDDRQSCHLKTVRNSAKDLHNLLNDILDVAKLEEGKLELECAPFSAKDLVHHIAKTFELKAKSKGVLLIERVSPNLSKHFLGDALRLKQILMNLLGNAIKFTDSGSILVAVEKNQNGLLQFMVRDTGIGIAKDSLGYIFDSFSQADTSTSRKYGGTGLGTTISKRLVELMGGEIWVESDEGVGTTFYFTIKVGETSQSALLEQFQIDPKLLSSDRALEILVAEDGEQNAELLRIRLGALGHKITRVVNGQVAVERFGENKFDIILMDIQMPVMDGIQATQEIRELSGGKEIPIIALTASVMQEDRKACFDAGMDGFVKKPIVFNELFTEMSKLLLSRFKADKSENNVKSTEAPISEIAYINVQQGIETWGSVKDFAKNLKQFAKLHHKDMHQFRMDIDSMNFDMASRLLHSLCGTAGNMALVDLFDEIQIMNGYLKRNDVVAIAEHIDILTNTFNASLEAIETFVLSKEPAEQKIKQTCQQALEQIEKLSELFLNGELGEPITNVLVGELDKLNIPAQWIEQLQLSIDNFEFELAIKSLNKIRQKLLEGERHATR